MSDDQLPVRRSEESAGGKKSPLAVRTNRVITIGETKDQEDRDGLGHATIHVSGDLHLYGNKEGTPAVVTSGTNPGDLVSLTPYERQRLRDLCYYDPYYSPYRWWNHYHSDSWSGGSWRTVMMVGGGLLFLVIVLFGMLALVGILALGLKSPAPVTTNVVVSSEPDRNVPMSFEEYLKSQSH